MSPRNFKPWTNPCVGSAHLSPSSDGHRLYVSIIMKGGQALGFFCDLVLGPLLEVLYQKAHDNSSRSSITTTKNNAISPNNADDEEGLRWKCSVSVFASLTALSANVSCKGIGLCAQCELRRKMYSFAHFCGEVNPTVEQRTFSAHEMKTYGDAAFGFLRAFFALSEQLGAASCDTMAGGAEQARQQQQDYHNETLAAMLYAILCHVEQHTKLASLAVKEKQQLLDQQQYQSLILPTMDTTNPTYVPVEPALPPSLDKPTTTPPISIVIISFSSSLLTSSTRLQHPCSFASVRAALQAKNPAVAPQDQEYIFAMLTSNPGNYSTIGGQWDKCKPGYRALPFLMVMGCEEDWEDFIDDFLRSYGKEIRAIGKLYVAVTAEDRGGRRF